MRATAFSSNCFSSAEDSREKISVAQPFSLASRQGDGRDQNTTAHLTPRQLEVLALLCEGLPNKLICRRLNVAPGTVKAHISSILRELGVSSRLQAVVAARQQGLLDPPSPEAGVAAGRNSPRGIGPGGFAETPARRFGHGHS